ncbi:MAG TPA: aminoacyl-tRNA hydrolase [Acidimicrobiales bacterium]|nr:aminoacyl-tRNA hydrolase [Acidimicrobiales bacterium]
MGNPGADYDGTRHNLGAEVASALANRHGATMRKSRERALVAEARVDGRLMVLAFPQTFVNLSGESVTRLVRRYGIDDDLARLVVVHDELDLPPGRVKVKEGGGTAGHNGLESIRTHLHSGAFVRVRIGIGKPPGRQDGADYVLRRFGKSERIEMDVAVEEAMDAVDLLFREGVAAAMMRFNTPRPTA